jgi:hypothetical protein
MKRRFFLIVLGFFSLIFLVYAINTLTEGFRVVASTSIMVDDTSRGVLTPDCKGITNSGSNDIFVPTKSQSEWAAFLANYPASVTVGDCGIWSSYIVVNSGSCDFAGSSFGSPQTVGSKCAPVGSKNTYAVTISCVQCWKLTSQSTCEANGCFWEPPGDCIGGTSYRVETREQTCNAITYSWKTGGWSSCNVGGNECGSGTQTRSVWCERSDGQNMGTSCDVYPGCSCASKPTTSQSCTLSCPFGRACIAGTCESCPLC